MRALKWLFSPVWVFAFAFTAGFLFGGPQQLDAMFSLKQCYWMQGQSCFLCGSMDCVDTENPEHCC